MTGAALGPLALIAAETESKSGMDMMDDGPSLALFFALVIGVSVAAVIVFPSIFRRLSLRRAVPGLALIGPILALVGGLIGTGAMTLSGRDVWFSFGVGLVAAISAIVVGLRLANPVARDLEQIASTVKAVAGGDRRVRTAVDRPDEIGELAAAVDELGGSLADAEARRQAADEERTAVVEALGHDLRTPLASLVVSLEAIEDGIGDPSSHLRAIRGNVTALERLIEDLFLLARAEAGALALNFEPIDLAELLDEAVEAVGPLAQGRSLAIASDVDRPVIVEGDHTALGRVFRNLLDNAVRHSPAGGAVAIEHRLVGSAVWVAVLDQGAGFPVDFVPRALDRFSQADAARSRRGSAGLGLAIADALVDAHDGKVVVHPGPGGRVDVELPLSSPWAWSGPDLVRTP